MDRLVVTRGQRALLDAALLPLDDADEHLVVAFAGRHSTPTGLRLVIREVLPAEPSSCVIAGVDEIALDGCGRVARRATNG